jgi:hypothetical protein
MTTVRFRATIMGSLFPTCLFNTLLNLLQVRSACGSSLIRFVPASATSTPPARYLIPVQQSRVRLGPPLPLRGFASPPDPCVRSDLLPGSSPSETARSPDTFRARYAYCGTWTRSAAASEAGCSSNLLEPLQFSSRSEDQVNQILNSLYFNQTVRAPPFRRAAASKPSNSFSRD